MLFTSTVEPGTFALLEKLMSLETLQPFALVGGTALALRYGHRSSVDLDLFCTHKFDKTPIEAELRRAFGDGFYYEGGHKTFGIFCYINKIKVDLVYTPHQLIEKSKVTDGIRIFSSNDIAAMKIQAILGRGRKKDFWDLYELLQHFSLEKIIHWHQLKYPSQMLAISIPNAITWFVDADETEAPVSFKGQTWEQVKKGISKAVRDYLS